MYILSDFSIIGALINSLANFLIIGMDHDFDELVEGGFGFPAEHGFSFGIVADEELDFGGAEVAGVDTSAHFAGVSLVGAAPSLRTAV